MTLPKTLLSAATLAAYALAHGASTQPVHLRLGQEGEILAWLVAGPFPNVGALELKGTGFATDYLAGEAVANAVEGRPIPMIPTEKATNPALTIRRAAGWRLGVGDAKSGIDLARMLDGGKPGIAYLYTELDSPRETDARILFGSDDGAKVWVNGEQRFVKQIARGIKRDEDAVPIHLRKGTNRLLFKIEQGNGGWGLLARVVGNGGRPISGLAQSLDVLPQVTTRDEGEAWIRRAAGKAGALDIQAALGYAEISKRAGRWVSRFRKEADNPAQLESILKRQSVRVSTGDDANALSDRLAAARDAIQRDFDRARARLLRETQLGRPLLATSVNSEDYIRVMPGGRYFVRANGQPFIPIGYNHNPDWPKLDEANPNRDEYIPTLPDKYLAHLKECGVNVLRLMIETPQSGNLEYPVGTFQPEHVRWIDTIVLAARKHGIKLIITPWDTFWMNLRWDATPYNPENGGLVQKRLDFITNPAIRAQQKRRLQFMIDRWGNSGTIFAWELLNEADLWWGANPAQLTDWTNDMARYVRTYEKRRWGRNHMLNVSFAEPLPKGNLAKLAFSSPYLDYASTHLYLGASRAPREPVGPAIAVAEGLRYCLDHLTDTRPYMDTENGPIDKWVDSPELDEQVFHGMIWTHMASGAAGSGFRWPYRNPHHLTEGMLQHLKKMSVFASQVKWPLLTGARVRTTIAGDKGAATTGFATTKSALLWTSGGGPITVTWPNGPKSARCRLYDTLDGKWLDLGRIAASNGTYSIAAPTHRPFAVILD